MTTLEIQKVISENIGARLMVTPTGSSDPDLVLVLSTDEEGFTYKILTDPALYDPKITHWWPFDDVSDVRLSS
jgi:hypothetical protein